ncbi:MAG TPA: radical SAM protein [bacterium]|nr:radical SAM protein [bacterium]
MSYVRRLYPHEFHACHKEPLLEHLDLELTERCNNACIHCCINQPEHDAELAAREMDTAFVKYLLRQAADLGAISVRFTGGEPLLRSDFTELYLFARRLGMQVTLFTNGRLITPELAQLLAIIPPGKPVEVTVYGMHPESYDAVAACRGAFAEFWRGIGLLQEYGIRFTVKQSLLPPNRGERAEFETWAATLPEMKQLSGYSMNFELRGRRDHPAKNRLIESFRLTPEETVALLAERPGYIDEMRQFCSKFMAPPGELVFQCGAGKGVMVDAYGKAQMCMGLRHPDYVYDLYQTAQAEAAGISPLKFALTHVFPEWREMKAAHPEYLSRCARCFLKGLCEQCPARSWQEHGTLDTPVEYLCNVAHAQARHLGLLAAGEKAWEVKNWRERIARFSSREAGKVFKMELNEKRINDGNRSQFEQHLYAVGRYRGAGDRRRVDHHPSCRRNRRYGG